jgi:putative FmdB family regulatory protein
MPIYEYRCTTCDCSFEMRQGFDTEPFSVCPRCHNKARRVFRPAPIIFKGSGFYVTDYGRGSSAMARSKSEETKETETKAEAVSAGASTYPADE